MPLLRADQVEAVLSRGHSTRVALDIPPRFRSGQAVLTKNINPQGHTRLPRYARGRKGLVLRDHGVFVFPDSSAAGTGDCPQHLYAVRFSAAELWGPEGEPGQYVIVDLFEDYLLPVGAGATSAK
ncbi:MAG TPA: SH3-like domain-containing protein [Kiloniellaceae bacterium]|nr:SH3-like domain-containing protein [Kiloniellaceae bacterium]